MPTQAEYNLAKQNVRINYYKIILLNYQFQNVGELTGDSIETPSFTIDANSVGQKNIRTKEIEYTNMGIYLINNPQRVYSATDNTLTIQGLDLMAKMTGLRNGNLQGMPYLIPQGSNVRVAIIAVLELAGFTRYVVDECPIDVEMIVVDEEDPDIVTYKTLNGKSKYNIMD